MACRFLSRLASVAAWLCLVGPAGSEVESARQGLPQYSVDTWTVKEGLPSGRVRAIAQTKDGYLWLLTTGGLVRFDGVRFTPSSELQQALEREIVSARAMLVTKDGGLWLGGGGFLCRLENGRGAVYRRSFDIATMAESAKGGLWLGFEHVGLTRFHDGEFRDYPSVGVVVASLVEDREHRLWLGTFGAGLHWLRGDTLVRHTARPPTSDPYVNAIAEDRQGRLWIGTRAGVTRFGSGQDPAGAAIRMLAASDVTALYEDHAGAIWIGTAQGGVHRFKDGRLDTLPPIARFAENGVLSICEDREGSVWVGMTDGLARLRPSRFTAYTTNEGLAHNNVAAVIEGRDGTVWTFSDGGGISAIRNGTVVRRITTRQGLASNYGGPLFEGRDGSIWAGTANGLSRIRDAQVTSYTSGLLARYVSALFEDDLGLVVAPGNGLFRFDRGALRPYLTTGKDEISNSYVYQALRSRDGTVWLATGKGLVRIAGGRHRVYTARDGLLDNNVRSIHEDGQGVLWLATAKVGIARLQGDRLVPLTMKDGLHDDRVYRVLDDRAGDLWLSSPRGIFRISRRDIEDYSAGRIPRLRTTDYDVADGLKTIECSIGAQPPGWRSRSGVLWFPTLHGVVSIDPARLQTNLVLPPVVIEEVVVDDRVIRPGKDLVLPPGSQRIDFHFTALSLLVPERVQFRYMLEGFDAGWIDAQGRRMASYTKVPPGSYRLRVMACNDDGLWNEEGATLSLRLKPRFRQTALFFWLAAGLLLLAAFGLYRLRVVELHSRYAAVLDERSRIAREMHDTFAQNLGGVALQLDSIKMQFRDLPAELAQRLDETGRMIRYSLAEAYRAIRDLRSHALDPPGLTAGLARIVARATAGSEIVAHVSLDEPRPPLGPTLENHLLRIAQEAVTNAVRHGQARTLHVLLGSTSDGQLRLEIRDDGRGFAGEHAFSLQAGHYGLIGLRERADRMGAQLTLDSRPAEGTRIVVELPAQH